MFCFSTSSSTTHLEDTTSEKLQLILTYSCDASTRLALDPCFHLRYVCHIYCRSSKRLCFTSQSSISCFVLGAVLGDNRAGVVSEFDQKNRHSAQVHQSSTIVSSQHLSFSRTKFEAIIVNVCLFIAAKL